MNPAARCICFHAPRIPVLVAGAFFALCPLAGWADAPTPNVRPSYIGTDLEGLQTVRLRWDAVSNATYLVQGAGSLTSSAPVWNPLDVVKPTNATGNYQLGVPATDSFGFYRLVLPQPEIFSVEPAVVDVSVSNTPLYILGQCLPTNALVLINGIYFTPTLINTGGVWAVVSLNGLPPGQPWTGISIVDAGTSNVIATLPNSVLGVDPSSPYLLEPPELPPTSPSRMTATLKKSNKQNGRDYPASAVATNAPKREGVSLSFSKIKYALRPPPAGTQNDPDVIGFSGEVRLQIQDFEIPGRGLDFNWTRTYRSRSTTNSSLGTRWTHSYDVNIQPLGGDIVVQDGTGRADRFFLQTNGTYTCPQFFREGTLTSGVFRLTFADTGYWQFNPTGASPSAGKLAFIVDRNGNTMSLAYDGAGRLTKVVDTLGRTNSIGYNGSGQLTTVTDFSGRTVTYQYYSGLPADPGGSAGDLKSVTSPPVTGTPNGNNFPLGKKTAYTYTTGSTVDLENHLLITVTDDDLQDIVESVYNLNPTSSSYLRCVSFQRWTNPPTMFSYLPQTPTPANQFATLRCVMNDPMGNVTETFFDARNRCVKLQEFTGRATPAVAVTDTANRPTGKVRVTDPDSYTTRWTWNNDSLCTLTVAPGGQQEQCVYASDFDKSTRARKRADLRVEREIASSGVDMNGDGLADLTERVSRYEYDPRFGSEPSIWKDDDKDRHGCPACPHPATTPNFGVCRGNDRKSLCTWINAYVTVATDPRGFFATVSYDPQGNCTSLSLPGIGVACYDLRVYNLQGELTIITNIPDANGRRRVDTFAYSQGWVVQSITDAGAGGLSLTNTFERDARGNVTRFVDARGFDWLYTYNALDQCVRAQSPVNLTARCNTDYFYDGNNNNFAVTRQLRNEADALVTTTTEYFRHDPLHRVTRVESPVDATQWLTNEFVYDGNDQCVLARGSGAVSGADPFQTVANQYDERGLLYREIAAPGSGAQSTTQVDYDPNGYPTVVSEGLEGTPSITTMEHDGFGGCGRLSNHSYGYGVVDDNGFSPVQARLKVWQLIEGQNGTQGLKKFDWAPKLEGGKEGLATSRLSQITDPMGNVTTFHYDANDNLKVTRHFGQTNDVAGSVGNIRLAESRYEYDSLDRLVVARDSFFTAATQAPIGDGERTTTFAYALNSQCTSLTDDLGRVTTYTYDTVGWPASESSPAGKTVYACFKDRAGNVSTASVTSIPDLGGPPQTFSHTNVFDSLNRCISTTDNVGNTNRYAYDSFGRVVTTTDPRGIRSFYTFDLLGRQTVAVLDLDGDGLPSLNDRTSSTYWTDPDPRWPGITADSHGNPKYYSYDSLGRCTSITNADGTLHTFAWDARNNLIGEQDANGTVVSHAYDLNNRCTANNYAPGPTVAATTTFEQFAYDGRSRLVGAMNNSATTAFAYDSLGHRTRDASGALATVSSFDSVGNPLSLTYPGGRALTFTHDTQDRITAIVESSLPLASFSYAGDRVERVAYANGLRAQITWAGLAGVPNAPGDFSWAAVSRIRHETTAGSALVAEFACYRDGAGNTSSASTAIPVPVLHTNTMTFGYDNADQLLNSIVTSNSALIGFATYGLDRMGNRTNINRPFCAGNYSLDATVPPADFQMNQYSSTPCDARTYDANGNLTNAMTGPFSGITYTYDALNRLVSVTDASTFTASYGYDALGRRILKTVSPTSLPPVTTTFLYDGSDVIEERVGGLPTATYVRRIYACQNGSCLTMRRSGQDYFFHTDMLGNTLALSTAGGAVVERYEYDDYGAVTFLTGGGVSTGATSSAVGNPYLWHSLRLDAETGLHNGDGGGVFDTQSSRCLARAQDDLQRTGSHLAANNPWSGGGSPKNSFAEACSSDKFAQVRGFKIGIIGEGGGDPYPISTGHDLPCPIITRPVLKDYFELGDKPTQSQFGSLIDSLLNYSDDGTARVYLVRTPRTVVQSSSRVYLVRTPRTVVQSSTISAKADSYDR